MEGSRYPNNVEVRAEDLQRTESTKATEIKARTSDFMQGTSGGIATGMRVTVGATLNTHVDISAGTAYTSSGERIVTTTSSTSVALSDDTLDVVNLVCIVYTQTATTPRPAETGGASLNTADEAGSLIQVYTQAAFDALPASLDSDLSQPAQDRVVKLAEVTGNGTGVPLTSGDITQEEVVTSSAVSVRYNDSNGPIPGIDVVRHGAIVAIGSPTADSANIELDVNPFPGTKTLRYRQAGSASYGASSADIASTIGEVTLTSAEGSTLTVNVYHNLITDNATTYNRDLTVEELYDQAGSAFSPADLAHRSKTGLGAQGSANPHGTGMQDIAQAIIEAIGSFVAGRGLDSTEIGVNAAKMFFNAFDTDVLATTFASLSKNSVLLESVLNGTHRQERLRILHGADEGDMVITFNAAPLEGQGGYAADVWGAGIRSYRLHLYRPALNFQLLIADATARLIPSWKEIASSSVTGGLLNLGFSFNGDVTADDNERARVKMDGAATQSANYPRTNLLESLETFGGATGMSNIRLYRATAETGTSSAGGSGTGFGFSTQASGALELTINARWNNDEIAVGDGRWVKDTTGVTASVKLELTHRGLALYYNLADAVHTDDVAAGGWSRVFTTDHLVGQSSWAFSYFNNGLSAASISGLTLPSSSDFAYDRLYRGMLPVVGGVLSHAAGAFPTFLRPEPVIEKGYNITTALLDGGSPEGIRVTFDTAMPDANYIVMLRARQTAGSFVNEDMFGTKVTAKDVIGFNFRLHFMNESTDENNDQSLSSGLSAHEYEFLVFENIA